MSNAAATLVGQNLGAGNPERAESAVWKTGSYNMIFLVAVAFVYFFFNRQLMGVFSDDHEVIAIGAEWCAAALVLFFCIRVVDGFSAGFQWCR
ncbi:MAG: MATE family efflux transporter [Mangrovibacterium sp.]